MIYIDFKDDLVMLTLTMMMVMTMMILNQHLKIKDSKSLARKTVVLVVAYGRKLVWKRTVSYLVASARLLLHRFFFLGASRIYYFEFWFSVSIPWCFFTFPDLVGFFHVSFTLVSFILLQFQGYYFYLGSTFVG